MSKPRILIVGSCVMDFTVITERIPNQGETVLGVSYSLAAGGKGANQAVQAARLGAETTLVGKVGSDSFGDALLNSLKTAGVNIEHITRDRDNMSAIGSITLEKKENTTTNRIIVVPGANMAIHRSDVEFLESFIDNYDIVIIQLEIPMLINEYVARLAFSHNIPVMLNPAPSAHLSEEILSHISFISPNEHEVKDLTGVEIKKEEDAYLAAELLRKKGVKNILVTLGSLGSVFVNENERLFSPANASAAVVDPTAAGDSFVSAYCTAIATGASNAAALEFANFTAGITVSKLGAQPSLPDINEVRQSIMQSSPCYIDKPFWERIMAK